MGASVIYSFGIGSGRLAVCWNNLHQMAPYKNFFFTNPSFLISIVHSTTYQLLVHFFTLSQSLSPISVLTSPSRPTLGLRGSLRRQAPSQYPTLAQPLCTVTFSVLTLKRSLSHSLGWLLVPSNLSFSWFILALPNFCWSLVLWMFILALPNCYWAFVLTFVGFDVNFCILFSR